MKAYLAITVRDDIKSQLDDSPYIYPTLFDLISDLYCFYYYTQELYREVKTDMDATSVTDASNHMLRVYQLRCTSSSIEKRRINTDAVMRYIKIHENEFKQMDDEFERHI